MPGSRRERKRGRSGSNRGLSFCIASYYKRTVKEAEEHAETLVRIPPSPEERLEAVARALHCTVPEAALLAVRTQPEKLEADLAAAADGTGPAENPGDSAVPQA